MARLNPHFKTSPAVHTSPQAPARKKRVVTVSREEEDSGVHALQQVMTKARTAAQKEHMVGIYPPTKVDGRIHTSLELIKSSQV